MVTDDEILSLITHLPRDLPEAFERALENISDRRYEGRIMKLVMSAVTPLDLDEIRVALCVSPGELVWHPERIAKDGRQLVTLCGGNLLELDDEDEKVRFIHHSVIQHLLSPAASQRTGPYHFTIENAENVIGATCVTYLQLPIFDSQMTITKSLQSRHVLDTVVNTTRLSLPTVSRLVEHIKSREHRRARPSRIDIGHIITQIQAFRTQVDLDCRCFAQYATSQWVHHTRFFDEEHQDCQKSWKLWWRLLYGAVPAIKSPCPNLEAEPFPALLWAVEQAHGSLFRNVLTEISLRPSHIVILLHALELHKSIHGRWLGNFLAQCLQRLSTIDMLTTANTITFILDSGANLNTPHPTSGSKPIKILTNRLGTDGMSEHELDYLIRTLLAHPAIRHSVEECDMLELLERLLENAKMDAITAILKLRPGLRFQFEQMSLTDISEYQKLGKNDSTNFVPLEPNPVTERAPDQNGWKEVETLALQGRVNVLTSSGTSLLLKAIETMSDEWVLRLLSLGADPNAGPFPMASRSSATKLFPLEAALWLFRTRVCLELLHHGADVVRLGESPMQIARRTGNTILIAKLYEGSDTLQRLSLVNYQEVPEHGRSALSTACSMLSFDCSNSYLQQYSESLHLYGNVSNWRAELDKIIYRLTLGVGPWYINSRDVEGKTALHYVAQAAKDISSSRLRTLLDLLLSRGADPTLADYRGMTSVLQAILNSAPVDSMIQPLLDAVADANLICRVNRRLLLEKAIESYMGSIQDVMKLVSVLIQAGADPRDPLHPARPDPKLMELARTRGMNELPAALVEHTQKWNEQILDRQEMGVKRTSPAIKVPLQ